MKRRTLKKRHTRFYGPGSLRKGYVHWRGWHKRCTALAVAAAEASRLWEMFRPREPLA